VADNVGAGDLIQDISQQRVPMRYAYVLILVITITLTWVTDVNGIIAYASRAFALYYTLQCAVAFIVAYKSDDQLKKPFLLLRFAILTVLCFLVFSLGLPAE
jgi:hypothetical protein